MRGVKWFLTLGLLLVAAVDAGAGWEIEQSSYSLRSSGKEIGRSSSTLLVSKERVRVIDEMTVTILDYDKDSIALLVPARKSYWTGTVDEYISAVRSVDPKRRVLPGQLDDLPKPEMVVKETPITAEIGGRHAKKFVVVVGGRAFQEIWVSEPFGLAKDLDPKRYQAVQRKIAQSVRSSYGVALNHLSEDPLYQKITYEDFPVRTHTYLGDAIMGNEVVRVTQKEIPDSEFTVPADFKPVSLVALLEAQQELVDAKVSALKAAQKKAQPPTPVRGKAHPRASKTKEPKKSNGR
jgi:hypothetical protein